MARDIMPKWGMISGVIITVPVELPAMAEKLRSRRGFEVIGGAYADRGNQFVRMMLRVSSGSNQQH